MPVVSHINHILYYWSPIINYSINRSMTIEKIPKNRSSWNDILLKYGYLQLAIWKAIYALPHLTWPDQWPWPVAISADAADGAARDRVTDRSAAVRPDGLPLWPTETVWPFGRYLPRTAAQRKPDSNTNARQARKMNKWRIPETSLIIEAGAFHDRSTIPDALISPILIKFGERGYLACQKHWSQS